MWCPHSITWSICSIVPTCKQADGGCSSLKNPESQTLFRAPPASLKALCKWLVQDLQEDEAER